MTDRPTPETDAAYFAQGATMYSMAGIMKGLERERDEAREDAEKAKAFKRVMKDDNAKLRRELDELNKRLIEVSQHGVDLLIEREDLRKEVAAERALADRLGHSIKRLSDLSPLIYAHAMDDLTAWKEARSE